MCSMRRQFQQQQHDDKRVKQIVLKPKGLRSGPDKWAVKAVAKLPCAQLIYKYVRVRGSVA